MGFTIDASGPTRQAVPELILLANEHGFRYLSRFFEYMADRDEYVPATYGETDPEDHVHLSYDMPGFMKEFSDRLEARIGSITDKNWDMIAKKFGLFKNRKKPKNIEELAERVLAEARAVLSRGPSCD